MEETIQSIAGLFIYFLPTILGYKKKNAKTIIILNIFTGFTVIGWIVALVFALKKEEKPIPNIENSIVEPKKIPIQNSNYINSVRVYLSGTHVASRKNYILKNGWDSMPVELEAEPNNKFDNNAIAVKHEGKLIGHIPGDKTHLVHPILNKEHYAQFDSLDIEDSISNPGETHLKVYLIIYYND